MTTYTIELDFKSAEQSEILSELQRANYNLIGFKGAEGPRQITSGVPAWFVIPFGNMFGTTKIEYTPEYKVFIYNTSQIAAQTEIEMQSLSGPTELGDCLTFSPTGQFNTGGVDHVPADSIGILNDRPADTPDLTVGLAGLVTTPQGASYMPFCAFNLPPQDLIVMTPLEQVLLVAAQLQLSSGSVQAHLAAPGCMFAFDATKDDYPLKVAPSTYALVSAGGAAVTPVGSGSEVALVNRPRA